MAVLRVDPDTAQRRILARVSGPSGRVVELFVEANVPLAADATPWLPALVPMAMLEGLDLHVAGPVDAVALRHCAAAQRVLAGWYRELTVVEAGCDEATEPIPAAAGVACLFSGGLDSFYSALRYRDRITHLLFAVGLEIAPGRQLDEVALAGVRAAARALGKPLIEVRTNLREHSRQRLSWGRHYHGAALAAIALALADHVGEVIVPSSFAAGQLHPWGSHPDLDRWWSSSRVAFRHDGAEVSRVQKAAAIAGEQVALDHLRVCFGNPAGAANCGSCEKCLRTMVNLYAAGALGRARTLPTTLHAPEVRRMRLYKHGDEVFAVENLAALRALPVRDAALERALRQAIWINRVRRPIGDARVRAIGWALARRADLAGGARQRATTP